jgi:rhodanese-related sulfurtransferase
MKTFRDLIDDCLPSVQEIFPWDLAELIISEQPPLLLDVREPREFGAFHIANSLNVPRGILETACDFGYEDTVPELVKSRDKQVVVICRSGNRSVLAAFVMQLMGYKNVSSLKTGIRGWNDFEQPLFDQQEQLVTTDDVDTILSVPPTPEQLGKL